MDPIDLVTCNKFSLFFVSHNWYVGLTHKHCHRDLLIEVLIVYRQETDVMVIGQGQYLNGYLCLLSQLLRNCKIYQQKGFCLT